LNQATYDHEKPGRRKLKTENYGTHKNIDFMDKSIGQHRYPTAGGYYNTLCRLCFHSPVSGLNIYYINEREKIQN
jgi:hypothetical protein